MWANNQPSPMLADRLKEGIRLYNEGVSEKIIVSGDHGKVDYDEVNVMKKYLIDAGIPSEDIFMDHAGFTTYDSMYRAKDIFNVKKAGISGELKQETPLKVFNDCNFIQFDEFSQKSLKYMSRRAQISCCC